MQNGYTRDAIWFVHSFNATVAVLKKKFLQHYYNKIKNWNLFMNYLLLSKHFCTVSLKSGPYAFNFYKTSRWILFLKPLFSQTGKLEIWIFGDLSKFQTEKMEQKVKSDIFMDLENLKSCMCQKYKLGNWSLKNWDLSNWIWNWKFELNWKIL